MCSQRFRQSALIALVSLILLSGCGSNGSVSASVHYGVGFYDPWYYDRTVNVNLPDRPIGRPPANRPTPLPAPAPRPRPRMRMR